MEQSPFWQANSSSYIPHLPRILWEQKAYCYIHTHLPPVPILTQTNTVLASTSHFLKIHFNIILFHLILKRNSKFQNSKESYLIDIKYFVFSEITYLYPEMLIFIILDIFTSLSNLCT